MAILSEPPDEAAERYGAKRAHNEAQKLRSRQRHEFAITISAAGYPEFPAMR